MDLHLEDKNIFFHLYRFKTNTEKTSMALSLRTLHEYFLTTVLIKLTHSRSTRLLSSPQSLIAFQIYCQDLREVHSLLHTLKVLYKLQQ